VFCERDKIIKQVIKQLIIKQVAGCDNSPNAATGTEFGRQVTRQMTAAYI